MENVVRAKYEGRWEDRGNLTIQWKEVEFPAEHGG